MYDSNDMSGGQAYSSYVLNDIRIRDYNEASNIINIAINQWKEY